MARYDDIKESENQREMAELILPLFCERKGCNHNCTQCTEDVMAFLEEDAR